MHEGLVLTCGLGLSLKVIVVVLVVFVLVVRVGLYRKSIQEFEAKVHCKTGRSKEHIL